MIKTVEKIESPGVVYESTYSYLRINYKNGDPHEWFITDHLANHTPVDKEQDNGSDQQQV